MTAPATQLAADPMMLLATIDSALDSLAATSWHEQPGQLTHDVLASLEHVGRRLAGVRAEVLTTADANGLWALSGAHTFPAWLRQHTRTTKAAASREVREARAMRDHLPATREALKAGQITTAHAGALARETTRTAELREQLAHAEVGEEFLLSQAGTMDATTFTTLAQRWAVAADPAGADRQWREADAKDELTISPTLGGWHLTGWLSPAAGQLLTTAIQAHAGRKGADDERTPAQRRAGALVGMAQQSLDTGLQDASARIRPHLTVTTSWETLQGIATATGTAMPEANAARSGSNDQEPGVTEESLFALTRATQEWAARWRSGDDHVISTTLDHDRLKALPPATLEDGTPIAPGLLARLACESQLARVVFGADSTVLDAGREKRIFPANQARAIIARDRTCQFPGCDEPPGFGEIHHSLWWYEHGGPTSTCHGILLCWHHHDWVHSHEITITRRDGHWHFTDRHDRPITSGLDPAAAIKSSTRPVACTPTDRGTRAELAPRAELATRAGLDTRADAGSRPATGAQSATGTRQTAHTRQPRGTRQTTGTRPVACAPADLSTRVDLRIRAAAGARADLSPRADLQARTAAHTRANLGSRADLSTQAAAHPRTPARSGSH